MTRNIKRILIFVVLLVALVMATAAQAVTITFQVRMSYQIELGTFDPDNDFVDVAGTFNSWGNSPLTPLADADGDTIYEVTVDGFTPTETIEFKFRMDGQWDGREEFSGGGSNRVYTVTESDNVILVWYNNQQPSAEVGPLHWWNDTVFYEILVRSFYDSDGDGIGDLPGLTQKLDYLNDGDPATSDDLGITGIWLMPINDSPSYHGYDAVDYRAINPDYGTMADFEAFLAAAHARGIKVIIDYVMNHCSNQHPWFVASSQNDPTYRDWFRWSPGDPGQGNWHWHSSGWYYGYFWGGMPDLNYETQAVKDEMFDTATYWLDTIGVDGFRLDAVLYIIEEGDQIQNTPGTFQFWEEYNTHVKGVKPDVLSVGEAWTGSSTVLQYVTEDRLDFCFEFELAYATVDAVNYSDTWYLGNKADQVYNLYPYLQFGTFLSNHDQNRSFDSLGNVESKAKVAAGIYLTLPGIPFVYYGEEIGMVGSGAHEYIRSPMQWTDGTNAGFTTGTPWQAINSNYQQFNVLVEEQDSGSLLSWYKKLIAVRNQSPALRRGTHDPLESSEWPVLAFVRQYEHETLLCMANTDVIAHGGLTVTGSARSLEPGDHKLVNLLDPSEILDITVSPDYEITGLLLEGHEVAVYKFESAAAVDPRQGSLPETGPHLEQAYPNPFNPSTKLSFVLASSGDVSLKVFDAAGRRVTTLVDEHRGAGRHEVVWNGRNESGRGVSSGVYFYSLETAGFKKTKQMTLIK